MGYQKDFVDFATEAVIVTISKTRGASVK